MPQNYCWCAKGNTGATSPQLYSGSHSDHNSFRPRSSLKVPRASSVGKNPKSLSAVTPTVSPPAAWTKNHHISNKSRTANNSPAPSNMEGVIVKIKIEDEDNISDHDLMGQPLQSHIDQRLAFEELYGFFMFYTCDNPHNLQKIQTANVLVRQRLKEFFRDEKCIHGWYAAIITMRVHLVDSANCARLWQIALKHQNRSLHCYASSFCLMLHPPRAC